jgi:hypothetical protein
LSPLIHHFWLAPLHAIHFDFCAKNPSPLGDVTSETVSVHFYSIGAPEFLSNATGERLIEGGRKHVDQKSQ